MGKFSWTFVRTILIVVKGEKIELEDTKFDA